MSTTHPTERKTASWGVPWEEAYGYPQAIQVWKDIFISGQFNHDKNGNLVVQV